VSAPFPINASSRLTTLNYFVMYSSSAGVLRHSADRRSNSDSGPGTPLAAESEGGIVVNSSFSGKLLKLGESDAVVRDPSEDIRGRKVFDAKFEEIGKVDDLLVDEQELKVRFIQISSGGLLGIGDRKILLPVDAVTQVNDDAVFVDQDRERLTGAPAYDPAIVDETYLNSVYDYYGYAPFWGTGYAYPSFPYYGPPRSRRSA
jgi:sporulation protein YlmC with PRC-barrel domain